MIQPKLAVGQQQQIY